MHLLHPTNPPRLLLLALLFLTLSGCAVQPLAAQRPDPVDVSAQARALQQATTNEDRLAAIRQLEEVVAEETTPHWLPHYLIGYGYAEVAHAETVADRVDGWCDRAAAALDVSGKLSPPQDEQLVALAYTNYGRIKVDVMKRGFTYSRIGMDQVNKALALNPDNPRAHFLKGQHFINTPIQFGGDADRACRENARALELYAAAPAGPITWGQAAARSLQQTGCAAILDSKK